MQQPTSLKSRDEAQVSATGENPSDPRPNRTPGLTRRQMIGALAVLPFTGTFLNAATTVPPVKPATFCLVHGAWHGGWCWKKLTPLLREAGHQVFTPTLTGLGERSHLISRDIGLATHINDIVAVLEFEDLHDVVLVGHSYAGMVISGVADRVPERIGRLVYLDAFLPENGKALVDYTPLPVVKDDGWRIAVPGIPPRFGVKDEHDSAWLEARLGDQPVKTFTEPVELSATDANVTSRSYVQCSERGVFAKTAERAKQQGLVYKELFGGGHDVMVTKPEALAKILFELAGVAG